MNPNDLRQLNNEINKISSIGNIAGKLFKRSKDPLRKRLKKAGNDLITSSGVVGAIGVGGFGYGAIKNNSPLNDRIMSRGKY